MEERCYGKSGECHSPPDVPNETSSKNTTNKHVLHRRTVRSLPQPMVLNPLRTVFDHDIKIVNNTNNDIRVKLY